jgi:hypothetical protein
MPLYFFNVHKNGRDFLAEHPLDLPDFAAAWEEATISCGQMVRDLDGQLAEGAECSIEIQDENRRTLRSLVVSSR